MAKFRFAPITTFAAPVKVIKPGGEEQEFVAQFVYLDDKQWAEKGALPSLDFLRAHWIGWAGIVGDDDQEIAYSEAMREALLGHDYVSRAVLGAYITGRSGQRAKN